MPQTSGPMPPRQPREPRLPLWFWGGLAAGLATLFVVVGLVAAGFIGSRASRPQTPPPSTLVAARPVATSKIPQVPTPTELPLLPTPTLLQPAATLAPILPASPAPVRLATITRAPSTTLLPSAPPLRVTRTPSPVAIGGLLPTAPAARTATVALTVPGATPTATQLVRPLASVGPAVTFMPTASRTATAPPTATASQTPVPPATLTATATATAVPTETLSATPTSQPTATSTATKAAPPTALPTVASSPTQGPKQTPTQAPPGQVPAAAMVEIMPVPAGQQNSAVLTATIKIITSTATSPDMETVALSTSGLPNVPISVPVTLRTRPVDPAAPGARVAWELTAPANSRARLTNMDAAQAVLVPDVPGYYKVDARLLNAAGQAGPLGSLRIHASTYAGLNAGQCGACHPQQTQGWAGTGHARIFSDEIDNRRTPDVPSQYTETCARCHTTGYYPAPYGSAGGFRDAMVKTRWQFPTWADINAAGKGGPSNWAKAPAEVKNLANVQCEVCHGPAGEHVAGQDRPGLMQSSQDEGICNQCHNGGGQYGKGTELQNAAHANRQAVAWTQPTGPGEQVCVRCHSGKGYVSFLANPQNPAAWDNTPQTVACATCHDPHGNGNPFQLRVVDRPVELPFAVKSNVGLSATCYECHNARNVAADAAGGQMNFPHYSSVAEFISDTGGVTYGKQIPDSPHGKAVGSQPVPNPAWQAGSAEPQFLFSKVGDAQGNVPGPCVVCHMWPTIQDPNDPNRHKVGGHSFNTLSPDGQFSYGSACKSCHGDIKSFNLPAKADYDGNGKVEGVQDEVAGLLNVLWQALEAHGVKKVPGGYPYVTLPEDAAGQTDPQITNAWYNFRNVYGVMWGDGTGDGNQGRAQAVHNFQRSVALLQLAYKDLTGQDVPGAAILVK
jgi:hypothetical protein